MREVKEGQNKKERKNKLMKTKLMKTSIRGASVALLVSAGVLLLLVAGIQGSGPAPSGGKGFQCTNATIRGT